jgi:hypothetical protein
MKLAEILNTEAEEFLKKHVLRYSTNPDGSIDVDRVLDLRMLDLKKLPVKFNKVSESVYINKNKLTSLEGAPTSVGGNFYCYSNELTSLEGGPCRVADSFDCDNNKLTSLKGAPAEIGSNFSCVDNQITSLEGIHKQIKKLNGKFIAPDNPIKSHVLGLLLIEGITEIYLDNRQVQNILNKHLGKGKAGLLTARQELLDLDLDDYAEL